MEEKALSIEDKIKTIENRLDSYFSKNKLNFAPLDSEIDDIFSLSQDGIKRLSNEIISQYSFLLSKYSTYIAKECNKEKSLLNWAKRSLDYIILPKLSNYRSGYMSGEELKMIAIGDNEVAMKLYKFIVDKELIVTAFDGIKTDIYNMARELNEIQKVRRFSG